MFPATRMSMIQPATTAMRAGVYTIPAGSPARTGGFVRAEQFIETTLRAKILNAGQQADADKCDR